MMSQPHTTLPPALTTCILTKLGVDQNPRANLENLQAIYLAWCQKIPFDNLRKRIHLESAAKDPLPGEDPADFFQGWLRHGTGGTCWAGSNALNALLSTLGFQVMRGLATMHDATSELPNHGTVIAVCNEVLYLVDTSMLHQVPLPLEQNFTAIDHPAWGIQSYPEKKTWRVQWRPLHMPEGCRCMLNERGVSGQVFALFNERTRRWGPFNYSLYARINKGDIVTGLAYGHTIIIDRKGRIERTRINDAQQRQFLVEEMGFSREIVQQLPADRTTPPPPGTAKNLQEH